MEGERRVVTMLFCDVKGSTAMAETLDPEDWTEIMNGAFERLIAPVYRYEGTLARLMGDAIFAFFGAPTAHEDDPQRAVSAGLDIISGIDSYKEDVRARHGLDLDVRVGIHTGPVMVGQVGSDLRLEYTAMGDAVNVAARMEQTADPGTVQVTAETHRLVESLFDVESRGGVEVKGKAEPVEAYTVLRRRHAHGAAREMRDSPFVGRERELEELTRAIEDAQAGGGRIVSIVGEAGLGKSRLVEEARAGEVRAGGGGGGGMGPGLAGRAGRGAAPRLGDVAMRLLRRDPPVLAIPAAGGPGRRDRRHRSARGGSEQARGHDGTRVGGPAGHAYGGVALAVRGLRARRGGARGRGFPRRDHRACDLLDPVARRRAAPPGLRGPALVRRSLDGPADRDRQAGRRHPEPVRVRVPPGSTGPVMAAEAVARDRVPASVDGALAHGAVRRRERPPDRRADPRRGRRRPRADPRAHRREPAVPGRGHRRRARAPRRHRDPDHPAGAVHRAARRPGRSGQAHVAARVGDRPLVQRAGAARGVGRRRHDADPDARARGPDRRDRAHARARVRVPP